MRNRIKFIFVLFLAGLSFSLQAAQAEKDSLFRLLQADVAHLKVEYGINYRIVEGNARFLHNDTYLLCDSASWNVDNRIIEAFGNVQIIQHNTMLKSEELTYLIDENTAKFRGGIVELYDKDGNVLRTDQLDYNTKDSLGIFRYGGAMMDSTKNVIESRVGTYDGKVSTFTFEDNVNLYIDSLFIKTNNLRYMADLEKAFFGTETFMWKDDGFVACRAGSYDRKNQVLYLADDAYMNNADYEAWSDEVYYDQKSGQVDMYAHSQILDTSNKTYFVGNHLQYRPQDSTAILTRNPAVVYYGENEDHVVDTLFCGADSIKVRDIPRCDIPDDDVAVADKRLDDMLFDALAHSRAEKAEAREKDRIEKLRSLGKLPPEPETSSQESDNSTEIVASADSLAFPVDSLAPPLDSLSLADAPPAAAADSLEAVRDTTPIRMIRAYSNFKLYRSDIQAVCDSVVFTALDSIIQMYGKPALWNDVKNQLTSEEMYLLMQNGNVVRGSMITDSWIISQQDSVHFNQIKSTEMTGFFHNNELYRFDALGGVSAVFYLVDGSDVTTINMKEAKSMTAMIKDGNARRLLYMEDIKSDAYPVTDLSNEKQRLKDFDWRWTERPVSREVITTETLRETMRGKYINESRPAFRQTDRYFDNYMSTLLKRKPAPSSPGNPITRQNREPAPFEPALRVLH